MTNRGDELILAIPEGKSLENSGSNENKKTQRNILSFIQLRIGKQSSSSKDEMFNTGTPLDVTPSSKKREALFKRLLKTGAVAEDQRSLFFEFLVNAHEEEEDQEALYKRAIQFFDQKRKEMQALRQPCFNKIDNIIAEGEEGDQQVEKYECLICFEQKPFYFFDQLEICGHKFCTNCITDYIKESLYSMNLLEIKCPGISCQRPILTDEEIEELVPNVLYEKYKRLKQTKIVSLNPSLRWCIKPGCSKVLSGPPSTMKLTCECSQAMCFNCLGSWHEGLDCTKVQEDKFHTYLKEENVKRCPFCKKQIEKAGGCNHMTCLACHFQFCWICLKPYTRSHYKWWNIWGCPNHMYKDINERKMIKMLLPCVYQVFLNVLSYLGMMAALIVGIILSLFGSLLGFLIPWHLAYKKNPKITIFKQVLLIIFGIIFYPLLLFPGCLLTLSRLNSIVEKY